MVLTQEIQEEAAKHPDVRLVITDATDNSDKQIADTNGCWISGSI